MYIYIYIYIYIYKTRLASNEIFPPSNKIYREVGRAKDLSATRYCTLPSRIQAHVSILRYTVISNYKSKNTCSRHLATNTPICSSNKELNNRKVVASGRTHPTQQTTNTYTNKQTHKRYNPSAAATTETLFNHTLQTPQFFITPSRLMTNDVDNRGHQQRVQIP